MTNENKRQLDLSLLLPLSLLILEVVAINILIAAGYEIPQFLLFIFILLAVFLVYRVGRQLFARWRIHRAITKIKEGQALADAGRHRQAIQLWKSLLFTLPQDQFLDVLQRIEAVYNHKNMEDAIQQVQAIHSESRDFFQMTRNLQKATPKDRRQWQAQAVELQNMIKALPEEPGQDLVDTQPEQ